MTKNIFAILLLAITFGLVLSPPQAQAGPPKARKHHWKHHTWHRHHHYWHRHHKAIVIR